jgi:hypothetical protein
MENLTSSWLLWKHYFETSVQFDYSGIKIEKFKY